MPCSFTFTGRTFANKSSALRIATLALSMFGHGSPACGVVVGPFKITWQALSSSKTSSGIALFAATRFSIVKPSMLRNSILPARTSSASMYSSTLADSFVMIGPMPSPPQTPIMILSSLSKSKNSFSALILSERADCSRTSSSNFLTAACKFSSVMG